MKTKKLVLDTKKPLGNPNSLKMVTMSTLALSIGVEYKVAPHLLSSGNYTALVYPLLLNIIPLGYPAWKWIKLHVIDYKIYKRLMSIVHSEQLIDYVEKKETTIFNEKKLNMASRSSMKKLQRVFTLLCTLMALSIVMPLRL